jgi:hypothetical protein
MLSKLTSLFSAFKNNLRKKFIVGLKNYFVGVLLMPWIWNFGFFGIQTFFVQFYLSRPNIEIINTFLTTSFNKQIELIDLWRMTLLIMVGNYTISFFVRQKQPKLSIILFLTTFLILFYMATLTVPFFRESIRNN